MRQRIINFMRGRYGVDSFSNFLMWAACIIIFANLFVRNYFLYLLGMITFIYAYTRIFSRKYDKRRTENARFLNRTYGIRMRFNKMLGRMRLRRTHRIYSCPDCGQKVKIPRGKGRVAVTCPKCGREFIKRS